MLLSTKGIPFDRESSLEMFSVVTPPDLDYGASFQGLGLETSSARCSDRDWSAIEIASSEERQKKRVGERRDELKEAEWEREIEKMTPTRDSEKIEGHSYGALIKTMPTALYQWVPLRRCMIHPQSENLWSWAYVTERYAPAIAALKIWRKRVPNASSSWLLRRVSLHLSIKG